MKEKKIVYMVIEISQNHNYKCMILVPIEFIALPIYEALDPAQHSAFMTDIYSLSLKRKEECLTRKLAKTRSTLNIMNSLDGNGIRILY